MKHYSAPKTEENLKWITFCDHRWNPENCVERAKSGSTCASLISKTVGISVWYLMSTTYSKKWKFSLLLNTSRTTTKYFGFHLDNRFNWIHVSGRKRSRLAFTLKERFINPLSNRLGCTGSTWWAVQNNRMAKFYNAVKINSCTLLLMLIAV